MKSSGFQFHFLFYCGSITHSTGNIVYLVNLTDRQNVFPKNNFYLKDAYESEEL